MSDGRLRAVRRRGRLGAAGCALGRWCSRSVQLLLLVCVVASPLRAEMRALVLQTDFGLKDGAVAAMKGVAVGVDQRVPIFDLTHEIAPFDVWEAAYRLRQAAPYWPQGTVFVSVVDPGVGTDRAAVVLQTKSGHTFVSPDNGTLTLVAEDLGIATVRKIDERIHRRPGSDQSHTFHGRDLFVLVAARLAAGVMPFEAVGPLQPPDVRRIDYPRAQVAAERIIGGIPVLDPNFGNVWTNIPQALLSEHGVRRGDLLRVTIRQDAQEVFRGEVRYVDTFGDVPVGSPLVYLNSLAEVALALNQESFADRHGIRAGAGWTVELEKVR